MNQRGILSHVQNVFFIIFIPPFAKQHVDYEHRWRVKSVQFSLCLPPPQDNMNVEHMKQIQILSQFEIDSPLTSPWSWHVESSHCYKLARLSPTKHYVRSTLKLTWHLESWFKCHFLPLQQSNTLNKLRQFILSHFWKLRPPDPTQQYVKHRKLAYWVIL